MQLQPRMHSVCNNGPPLFATAVSRSRSTRKKRLGTHAWPSMGAALLTMALLDRPATPSFRPPAPLGRLIRMHANALSLVACHNRPSDHCGTSLQHGLLSHQVAISYTRTHYCRNNLDDFQGFQYLTTLRVTSAVCKPSSDVFQAEARDGNQRPYVANMRSLDRHAPALTSRQPFRRRAPPSPTSSGDVNKAW